MKTFVSLDIETDGLCPGLNSILSLGASCFEISGGDDPIDTFSANFERLKSAKPDPDTMDFWKRWPQAYTAAREEPRFSPNDGIVLFDEWMLSLPGDPFIVMWPSSFDWPFIRVYLSMAGLERTPWNTVGVCMKSYAMCMFGKETFDFQSFHLPNELGEMMKASQNHVALDDSIAQGRVFQRLLGYRRNSRSSKK